MDVDPYNGNTFENETEPEERPWNKKKIIVIGAVIVAVITALVLQ